MQTRRFTWDTIERLAWTTLEFVCGLVIVDVTPLTTWWAMPIGVGLALLKALAAKHIGQTNTASTLPASADPAGKGSSVPPPVYP